MHFFPATVTNLYEAMTAAAVSGTAVIESDDEAYRHWAESMAGYASSTNSGGMPSIGFWLVVRLDADNFSETLEMHQKLPMMIPADGTGVLIGIARDQNELDKIVEAETGKYVYLTYKIKLQGQHAWRTLLEFMGEHNMLEKQDN